MPTLLVLIQRHVICDVQITKFTVAMTDDSTSDQFFTVIAKKNISYHRDQFQRV